MNHGEDSLGELVDARNLVVMLPRLLRDFQDVEPQQVTPTKQQSKYNKLEIKRQNSR